MRVVLRQTFPLGRFHATPWRVNPFDDPFGEWPPSPWRLVRAICARWYQWQRERGDRESGDIDSLLRALCGSRYAFWLPPFARRGMVLRQYQPATFGWHPPLKEKKDKKTGEKKAVPGIRAYGTTLVQDNAWCVPPDDADESAVWWFVDGDAWTQNLMGILDRCLDRIVYFGRAETLTVIERRNFADRIDPNCTLDGRPRSAESIPVLVPTGEARREDVERITDDKAAKGRTVPPGARWLYAEIPRRPQTRERLRRPAPPRTNLIQFALGWAVAPELRSAVRLTAAFRSRVLSAFVRARSGDPKGTWSTAPAAVREEASGLSGKNASGDRLEGHRHAAFLVWVEDDLITRLLVWRPEDPFSADEHGAILRAAERALSWAAIGAQGGEEWTVRLVPLDRAVPPPPGLDGRRARCWESVTPYVPPRHQLRRSKPRASESIEAQVRRELGLRGFVGAELAIVQETGRPEWVCVHVPRRERGKRAFVGDRLGYWLRLVFSEPVVGPLTLGHSAHFGLGQFRPER
ncbi:MAG: type I-U CRISPR-associated protein Csb2 [Candidatus Binatia bacterium]